MPDAAMPKVCVAVAVWALNICGEQRMGKGVRRMSKA